MIISFDAQFSFCGTSSAPCAFDGNEEKKAHDEREERFQFLNVENRISKSRVC